MISPESNSLRSHIQNYGPPGMIRPVDAVVDKGVFHLPTFKQILGNGKIIIKIRCILQMRNEKMSGKRQPMKLIEILLTDKHQKPFRIDPKGFYFVNAP